MISFTQYLKDRHIDAPKGNVTGEWFAKHGYPMVVRCTCCDMTMAIFSAYVDKQGYTYCVDCAGVKED